MTSKTSWLVLSAIVSGLLLSLGTAWALRPSPQEALDAFYGRRQVPEETIADPLIVAGERVVPFVLAEIRKKTMPRRTYAIDFLGSGGHREALPDLRRIAADETESIPVRRAALVAVFGIDESEGKLEARKYVGRRDMLGEEAGVLLRSTSPAFEPPRTLLQAIFGWLDS